MYHAIVRDGKKLKVELIVCQKALAQCPCIGKTLGFRGRSVLIAVGRFGCVFSVCLDPRQIGFNILVNLPDDGIYARVIFRIQRRGLIDEFIFADRVSSAISTASSEKEAKRRCADQSPIHLRGPAIKSSGALATSRSMIDQAATFCASCTRSILSSVSSGVWCKSK